MKRLVALCLSLLLILPMTACYGEKSDSNDDIVAAGQTTVKQETLTTTTEKQCEDTTTEQQTTIAENELGSISNTKEQTTASAKISSTQKKTTVTKQQTTASTKISSTQKTSQTTKSENQSMLKYITARHTGKKIKIGDSLTNKDFEVIGYYSDGSEEPITDFTIDVKTLQKVGDNTILISYKSKVFSLTLHVYEANDVNANSGGEFGYDINDDGELTITTYVGAKTDVIVPTWIDDMPVTGISGLSKKVTSVVLPNSITRIERHAFSGNSNLVSVTLGPNITEIGDNVFYQCTNLKNVTIKKGATLIGDSMFSCTALEKIVLPDTIEKIGSSAFWGCEKLKEITIPSSVKEIHEYAVLSYCGSLEKIYVKQNSYAQRWCLNKGYGEKLMYY